MRAIVTRAAVNPAAATMTTIDLSLFQHRRRHRQLAGSPSSPPRLSTPLPHIVIAAVHVRALNVSLMVRRDSDTLSPSFQASINSVTSIDVHHIEIRDRIVSIAKRSVLHRISIATIANVVTKK